MTELHAIKESIELWDWLVDNFPKKKRDHPEFDNKYKNYNCHCPCCNVYELCTLCPLQDCVSDKSDYAIRNEFLSTVDGDFRQALKATKNISRKLKKRLIGLEK